MSAARYQKRERVALQAQFLKALSCGKTADASACSVGLPRRTLYRWRREDPLFAERWQLATARKAPEPTMDPLELEAMRRAVEGTEKPVFRGGTCVGHTVDYSDSMLMFLLKAKYPEKYDRREKGAGVDDPLLDIAGARDALLSKFAQAAQ